MAALTRPTQATYAIHERTIMEIEDRRDHTFCGIMFPVECKDILPIDHIAISSLSVRGKLGPISIWVTKTREDYELEERQAEAESEDDDGDTMFDRDSGTVAKRICGAKKTPKKKKTRRDRRPPAVSVSGVVSNPTIRTDRSQWKQIYSQRFSPSEHTLQSLDLSCDPIILKPGQVRGIYIHSSLPGDESIVYDNHFDRYNRFDTSQDSALRIHVAMAHLSEQPFGTTPIWGWGEAWRRDRKFVGAVEYGVVFRLWNPKENELFGTHFRDVARTMLMCQRREESPLSLMPDECLYYIMNMCRWDWVGDGTEGMENGAVLRTRRRRRVIDALEAEQLSRTDIEEEEEKEKEEDDRKPSSASGTAKAVNHDDETEMHVQSEDEDDDDDDDDTSDVDSETREEDLRSRHSHVLYSENTEVVSSDQVRRTVPGRASFMQRFFTRFPVEENLFFQNGDSGGEGEDDDDEDAEWEEHEMSDEVTDED